MTRKRRYFGTDGIRGRVGEPPISADFILHLGWAVGHVMGGQKGGKALIAKDTRISGYMFESALEAGLSAAGINIQLIGPMPTPGLAYLTRTLRADLGIMISASHNPHHDNGIKFFSGRGFKLPDTTELMIEEYLAQPMQTVPSHQLGKASRLPDAVGRYIEFCKSSVPYLTDLSGLKIVVDCANGATYHVAPNVLRELGAQVIPIHNKPDGLNINDQCGSLHPENLQQTVLAHGADVGIALDGDGDRVIMVDNKGEVIDGDEILYIIAREHFVHGRLKGGVVGTVMSNLGLEQSLGTLGIEFVRAKVGDRYVLEQLQQQGWTLGGEGSGHIICLDVTTTGDGIIAALQVLYAMSTSGRDLHELKSQMQKYPQIIRNISVGQPVEDMLSIKAIHDAVHAVQAELGQQGRVLLRRSGTEPLVRVMVEGEEKNQVVRLADDLAQVVSQSLA
ncbi:MAG: phosphoglucosamine mutase [Gammaproteobacteria bacterium]